MPDLCLHPFMTVVPRLGGLTVNIGGLVDSGQTLGGGSVLQPLPGGIKPQAILMLGHQLFLKKDGFKLQSRKKC